jgi:hypothetical protein
MAKAVKHFLTYLLAMCISSFENYLFSYLPISSLKNEFRSRDWKVTTTGE